MVLPIVIIPGYLENAIAYRPLEVELHKRGLTVTTVAMRRRDWLETIASRSVVSVLEKLDQTIQQVQRVSNSEQVNLLGHSAGGWIGRIYLGEIPYGRSDRQFIRKAVPTISTLVTLGTPHTSQERWTRGNLDFVNTNYPGAFYPHVRYVCVGGKSVFGQRYGRNWFAYSSYQQTCGNGATWGDGITPLCSAHLAGAENITVEGVLHSPRSPGIWYGSPEVVKKWVGYLEQEAGDGEK
ncbi:esterase/lipase family protein [Calothrix sp. NIES-3974]|uniref:esterase/lipase family protein n=1 Tax=Calothrix sp. NIES-3974 TaxID=2005462 RepID=UPI000B606217|nr:lipase [Calothrix sp. NIES-3974]BAZ06249.1 hypothetical protein NIES3974_29070 [Calothrix sp. NIES-3974]